MGVLISLVILHESDLTWLIIVTPVYGGFSDPLVHISLLGFRLRAPVIASSTVYNSIFMLAYSFPLYLSLALNSHGLPRLLLWC